MSHTEQNFDLNALIEDGRPNLISRAFKAGAVPTTTHLNRAIDLVVRSDSERHIVKITSVTRMRVLTAVARGLAERLPSGIDEAIQTLRQSNRMKKRHIIKKLEQAQAYAPQGFGG